MASTKPLLAVHIGECHVVVSHAHRDDGYFRKQWGTGSARASEYFHRAVWQHHNGPIPEGFDLDHICMNRACFNLDHLRLMKESDHMRHTRVSYFERRSKPVFTAWQETDASAQELSNLFSIPAQTIRRWIRDWKKNDRPTSRLPRRACAVHQQRRRVQGGSQGPR